MKHARLFVAALALVVAGAALPQAAEAQLKFGAHAAFAENIGEDGSFGLGARVGIDPPLLPFSFWAHGDYYFPDDVGSISTGYQTVGADVHFSPLPFPMVTPYLSGGVLYRRATLEGFDASSATGFVVGAGVDIGVLVSGTIQIRREFFADDADVPGDQWTIRAGITF
jgi:hypothetical protein